MKLPASPRITLLPAATAALTVVAAFAPVSLMVIEPPADVTLAVVTVTVWAPLVSTTSKPETLVRVERSAAFAPKFRVSVPAPPTIVSSVARRLAAVTESLAPARLTL